jgi:hypothetical protein
MKTKIMAVDIDLYGEDGALTTHSWVATGLPDTAIHQSITHVDGEGVRIVLDTIGKTKYSPIKSVF